MIEKKSDDSFVTVKELASELRLSRQSIRNHVKKGLLPEPERVGPKAVRWRRSVIDDALSRMNTGRRIRFADQ